MRSMVINANVTYRLQSQVIREDDDLHYADPDKLPAPMRERVIEIASHRQVASVEVLGIDLDGYLIVQRYDESYSVYDEHVLPYDVMYVTRDGKVAEERRDMEFYPTFLELVTDHTSNYDPTPY